MKNRHRCKLKDLEFCKFVDMVENGSLNEEMALEAFERVAESK